MRLNVPSRMVRAVEGIYANPQLSSGFKGESSTVRRQEAGIRQGCPLSPYLFILVVTVMFHDIQSEHGADLGAGNISNLNFTSILYADDTMCDQGR